MFKIFFISTLLMKINFVRNVMLTWSTPIPQMMSPMYPVYEILNLSKFYSWYYIEICIEIHFVYDDSIIPFFLILNKFEKVRRVIYLTYLSVSVFSFIKFILKMSINYSFLVSIGHYLHYSCWRTSGQPCLTTG